MIIPILIVLIPILVACISVSVYCFVYVLVDRISFYKQIKLICKTKEYNITFPRKILSPIFRYSNKPDIIVKKGKENYMIRFITCTDKTLFYNFPSPEWYVSFQRMLSMPINPSGRFRHLPPFDTKYYSINDDTENKYLIIFSPRMPKTSFLKDNDSKRELAGNTIRIGDWEIYHSKFFLDKL